MSQPKQLRELANISYGKSPSDALHVDGEFPVYGTGGRYAQAVRATVDAGIVVPRKGSLGAPHLANHPHWPSDTTFSVLAKPGVNLEWLFYALSNFDFTKLNEATGVPSISRSWLEKIELSTPRHDERRQYVARVLRTADTAIEKTEALIHKYRRIKAGLMHDLFTRGIGPDGQLRPPREQAPELYQETPIGWIPADWSCVTLSQLSGLDVGFAFKSEWFRSDGVPLLRGENVGYGVPDWHDRQCLPTNMTHQYTQYSLCPGEVVIGMDRSFTKSGAKITVMRESDCPALLVQRVGRFSPGDCVAAFLRWLVMSEQYLRQLVALQKGMDIPHLSKDEILSPLVPKPPEMEQEKIAGRIQVVESRISADQTSLQKLNSIKGGLMNALLSTDQNRHSA